MEKFVQEFWKVARRSRYEERTLIEEFKRRMNKEIRKNLVEAEKPLTGIEQQYKQATNLDRRSEVECYTGYILAYLLQSRNQLKDRKDKDDKVSRKM